MKFELRSVLLALAFAALGFLAADRMSAAQARAAAPAAAPVQQAFPGTNGALSISTDWVIVVRDNKVYKLNVGRGGDNNRERPWMLLE